MAASRPNQAAQLIERSFGARPEFDSRLEPCKFFARPRFDFGLEPGLEPELDSGLNFAFFFARPELDSGLNFAFFFARHATPKISGSENDILALHPRRI